MVMQETALAPHLPVLENIFLPELGRPGPLSYRRMRRRAEEVLESLGVANSLPLDRDVESLSAAQRQLVEIAKAILYLATDDSSFCTGTVLVADGGWTAR